MPVRSRFQLLAAPILCAALIGGCSSPPGTIFRERALVNGGQLDLTDSRVRAITTQVPDISTKPGVVVPSSITCVEPPPSVALALANGLGVGISVLQYGSGALSNAVSENVIQTEERTIAIQALLNAGYQNCLDYSNGAITNTFYAIRASNLDNLLVTMALASEAAGNLRSNLGSASTQAAAEAEASQSFLANSVEDIQKSAQVLGDARRNTTAAREKVVTEKSELQAASQARQNAQADEKKARDEGKTGAELQPFTEAVTNTTTAEEKEKGELETAEAELKAAEQQQDDIENAMLNKIDATTSAEAGGKDVRGAGGPSGRPTDTAVLTIGEMQRRFLDRSTSGQYITACLVELGLSTEDVSAAVPYNAPSDLSTGQVNAPPQQSVPPRKTFERELWDEAGKDFLKGRLSGSEREDPKFEQEDATTFQLFARSERHSAMTRFCHDILEDTVRDSMANEQALAMERVRTERLQTAAHLLEVRAQVSEQCAKIVGDNEPEKSRRAACLKQLESVDLFIQREFSS